MKMNIAKIPEPRSEEHWQAVERYAEEHEGDGQDRENRELGPLFSQEQAARRFEEMRAAAEGREKSEELWSQDAKKP